MECTGSVLEVRHHVQLSIDLILSLWYFAIKTSSHLVTGIVQDFLHNTCIYAVVQKTICYHRKIIFKEILITFNLTETLEVLRLLGSDGQIALTKAKLEILAFQDPLDCDISTFVINVSSSNPNPNL